MSDNVILEIKNVTKFFSKRKVIDNISLDIKEGEVFGFLGPNGAGKTTTIKMVVGLISHDSGTIKINGYDNVKKQEKALSYVGAIVENPDMYDYLSGYENLKLKARIFDIKKERINEVVELVGLKDRIKDKVKKYSLGMKQRLGLAQALLHNPKILILDEPTNGLDPAGIRELRDILKKLAHKEGVTVFVSSHILNEMQLMCDRIAVIDNGQIIKVENINDALTVNNSDNKNMYKIYINTLNKLTEVFKDSNYEYKVDNDITSFDIMLKKEEVPNVVKLLVKNKIDIYEIIKEKVSLEDAFLNITKGGNK